MGTFISIQEVILLIYYPLLHLVRWDTATCGGRYNVSYTYDSLVRMYLVANLRVNSNYHAGLVTFRCNVCDEA